MVQINKILEGTLLKEDGKWIIEYVKEPIGYLDSHPAILYVRLDPNQDDEFLREGQEVKFFINGFPAYEIITNSEDPKYFEETEIAFLYVEPELNPGLLLSDPIESEEDTYSPYCPDCEACGESGCCSPLMCNHTENGRYCKGYLKELQFGYHMYRWFEKNLLEHLPIEKIDEYDKECDEAYDVFVMNERKPKEDESI